MVILKPVQYDDGTDSLSEFLKELSEKHKNEEEKYIAPLIEVINDFKSKGPLINIGASKKFSPYKKLPEINKDLSELRTYECRYFIYQIGKSEWIGLHGYEKQGNEMPKSEKKKVKGEIKRWVQRKKKE